MCAVCRMRRKRQHENGERRRDEERRGGDRRGDDEGYWRDEVSKGEMQPLTLTDLLLCVRFLCFVRRHLLQCASDVYIIV